jgi:rhamnose transport system ATP-binding protein
MALATGAGDSSEHVEIDLSALDDPAALTGLPGETPPAGPGIPAEPGSPSRPARSTTLQEEK